MMDCLYKCIYFQIYLLCSAYDIVYNSEVYFMSFSLDGLFKNKSIVLKSSVILARLFRPFYVHWCFIKLGVPTFGVYIFTAVWSFSM